MDRTPNHLERSAALRNGQRGPRSRVVFMVHVNPPSRRGHSVKKEEHRPRCPHHCNNQSCPGAWSHSRAPPAVPQCAQKTHGEDCGVVACRFSQEKETPLRPAPEPCEAEGLNPNAGESEEPVELPQPSFSHRAARRTACLFLSVLILLCCLLFALHLHGVPMSWRFQRCFGAPSNLWYDVTHSRPT
ncbi:hypothetical protein AOLI_G00055700 [Acnodon oligacanthus]